MSQSTRASGDEAPYFFEASRAALMASELSTRSERAVARRCWEIMLAGAKADVDATKSEVRRSFIVICLCVFCLFGCDIYRPSFYEEEGMSSLWNDAAEVREFALLVCDGKDPLLMADSCFCLGQLASAIWHFAAICPWKLRHCPFCVQLSHFPTLPHITHHRPHRSTK